MYIHNTKIHSLNFFWTPPIEPDMAAAPSKQTDVISFHSIVKFDYILDSSSNIDWEATFSTLWRPIKRSTGM